MNVNEILAKVKDVLQDATVASVIKDINNAVSFIASQTYLPELVTDGVVTFGSTVKTIAAATNASPIVVTTSVAHTFSTGQSLVVAEVFGNTAANGTWYIEVLSDDTFSLLGSEGNGSYVSGGTATRRYPSVDMPSDYDHDLFKAFSVTQDIDLNIRSNLKSISLLYAASERVNGEITDVAVEGNKLYGLPVPESDDIVMLSYYRKPTDLTQIAGIPTCIPAHLHESLIVSYILSQKFPFIEDGEDGKTPNTNRHLELFNSGIAALRAYYPRPSILRPVIKREFHFF